MATIDQLREIATTKGTLTDAQRSFVVRTAAKYGVQFEPQNTRCADCYKDTAMVLWRLLSEKAAAKDKTRKYILRAGVDVIWKNTRINAATLTDEKAAEWVAGGFPIDFFYKRPTE